MPENAPNSQIVDDLDYSPDHEWIRVEGMVATIGITDFAQSSLGDIVYVELPEMDDSATSGQSVCEIESTKSVSDIIAPLDGRVTEINSALAADPSVVNSDPYGSGWLFKLEITDQTQIGQLLDASAYRALIESS